ncbi:MAG: phosphoribulokinase [Candidatus Limnocylindrales bacterium]|nr:phosphoribulokinase [Candidatus Limnocylindrales bacterium]
MRKTDTQLKRPIFIAIGGDSGTGKSTLAAGFYRIFGESRITTLCLDDYHSLDRRERRLLGITALDPRANDFFRMESQLLDLKRGHPIVKPVYDHRDGTFGEPEEVIPREVVIVQGLHPFLVPGVRALFDLKVWLDPQEALKHRWKVQRDVAKRGYTPEAVALEIEARRPDVEAYVSPQRRLADLIVRFYRPPGKGDDEHLNVRITTRATLPSLKLDGLLDETRTGVRAASGEDDEKASDILEIDGGIDRATVRDLEDRIWDHMDARHQHLRHLAPEQFGDFADGALRKHHSDPLALTQILLVHRILSAKKSMLLRVDLSAHESSDHDHELEGIAHDHEHP